MGIFIMPAGVTSVVAEMWGWGSNGEGAPSSGPGGGGGAYARGEAVVVIPGDTYNILDDGTSWYFRWVSGGNIDLVKADGANPFFGTSFPGQAASCIGDVKYSGGAGFDTFAGPVPADGGGGGSGATRVGAGNPGAQPAGGASDDPGGGGGGNGGTGLTLPAANGHDADGPAPGGGGGGAAYQNGNGATGGAKRSGGGVVWLNSDWNYGTGQPSTGAIPVSNDGNFQPPPVPASAKLRKRAFMLCL